MKNPLLMQKGIRDFSHSGVDKVSRTDQQSISTTQRSPSNLSVRRIGDQESIITVTNAQEIMQGLAQRHGNNSESGLFPKTITSPQGFGHSRGKKSYRFGFTLEG